MKETTDRTKSIKPWYGILVDWLKELVPYGNLNEYMRIDVCRPDKPGYGFGLGVGGIAVTFYSHTYKYVLDVDEDKMHLMAIDRKPIAGTEDMRNRQFYKSGHIYNGAFSDDGWNQLKNAIVQRESVKIVKYARASKY